ncbi:MAG: Sec-independent protein translocase protein TatB [Halioglobus sp.]
MFDIGFAELVIIAVVSLLVIGPERLPSTIRTASLWLNRIKRGFNDIKQEVQQELHNDSVMQELRKTGEQLQQQTKDIQNSIHDTAEVSSSATPEETPGTGTDPVRPSTPVSDSGNKSAE